jgi:hypothetical protein
MEETKRRPILNKGSDRDLAPAGSVPGAQPPIETDPVRQTKRHETAAGFPAVVRTVRYVTGRMGVARGASALFEVNKLHGFDCQGCAWPSPDDHRHFAEFCENGAKAVSDEGTFRRITPEFFAKYSVHELLQKSDFWLSEQGRLTHPMILRDG